MEKTNLTLAFIVRRFAIEALLQSQNAKHTLLIPINALPRLLRLIMGRDRR